MGWGGAGFLLLRRTQASLHRDGKEGGLGAVTQVTPLAFKNCFLATFPSKPTAVASSSCNAAAWALVSEPGQMGFQMFEIFRFSMF